MKKCKVCGETKPLEEMRKHDNAKDGYLSQCKECYFSKIFAVKEKICNVCKVIKPLEDFHKGSGKYRKQVRCKECDKRLYDTPERLKRIAEYKQQKRNIDPEYRKREARLTRENNRKNIIPYLIRMAKHRSKLKNIEFNITKEDLSIPEKCPLLDIELQVNDNKKAYNSYSIDRIDNTKGYIKGNVWLISIKANMMKSDATIEELELLAKNMRKYLK